MRANSQFRNTRRQLFIAYIAEQKI